MNSRATTRVQFQDGALTSGASLSFASEKWEGQQSPPHRTERASPEQECWALLPPPGPLLSPGLQLLFHL